MKIVDFNQLKGKILKSISLLKEEDGNDCDKLIFILSNNMRYEMFHSQDCCESVSIDDIEGDLNDLLNTPIISAEETTNSDDKFGKDISEYDSFTWTFYKLATTKGYVTIKWLGTSNGCYSETANLYILD